MTFIIALTLLFSSNLWAWEDLPEFHSLVPEEQEAFETSEWLGPSYTSDLLTYQKPISWNYLWLSNRKALEMSAGSVDAAHFAMSNRLKIHHPWNSGFEFRLTYLDESERESKNKHLIPELLFFPIPHAGFGVYGEATHNKAEDDTGLALFFRPTSRHEIRLFQTFVDAPRQRRNTKTDTFIEPDIPFSRGLVGRLYASPEGERRGDFLEYALRQETRTRWSFPDSAYEYRYRKYFATIWLSHGWHQNIRINFRLQWDRKFEARAPTSDTSTQRHESWRTDRFFALNECEIHRFLPWRDWIWVPGFQYAYREWETEPWGNTRYRDYNLYSWVLIPVFKNGPKTDALKPGLETRIHQVVGPRHMRNPDDWTDRVWQNRFNLAYQFSFGEASKFVLMATSNLNRFGSRATWEGGNAQLQLAF